MNGRGNGGTLGVEPPSSVDGADTLCWSQPIECGYQSIFRFWRHDLIFLAKRKVRSDTIKAFQEESDESSRDPDHSGPRVSNYVDTQQLEVSISDETSVF